MAKEILIADSDKMVQGELEKIFEASDYRILFSNNDEEALLRGRLFKPDLIIGGKSLCSAIRADDELKRIPFILMSGIFEDLSEKDKSSVQADGLISRPLNEDIILNTVDRLMEKGREETKPFGVPDEGLDWKAFSDTEKATGDEEAELSLDGLRDSEEEEIIELVDVVEEPESSISINDLALQAKGEGQPFEPWDKQEEEKADEELDGLSVESEGAANEEVSLYGQEQLESKSESPEEKILGKIELEEILSKIEEFQPSIEREWPVESEKVAVDAKPAPGKAGEGYEQFEAALQKRVEAQAEEDVLSPFSMEEVQLETLKTIPTEEPPAKPELQVLSEEEFPDAFLEELETELKVLEEGEQLPIEAREGMEEIGIAQDEIKEEVEEMEEEELEELGEEDLGEEELEELGEEDLGGEELDALGEEGLGDEKLDALEEEELEEGDIAEFFKEEGGSPVTSLEERPEVLTPSEEPGEIEAEKLEEAFPEIFKEELPPPSIRLDRKVEEIISSRVQEMMQDFVTKIIPEITQNMVTLTLDRIEKMVKEVVPDLAERAIQEEIQRLQREEKE